MKKFMFLSALMAVFVFANYDYKLESKLLSLATDDMSGLHPDDVDCQNAIMDYYVLVKKLETNKSVEVDDKENIIKKYKECISKKKG